MATQNISKYYPAEEEAQMKKVCTTSAATDVCIRSEVPVALLIAC